MNPAFGAISKPNSVPNAVPIDAIKSPCNKKILRISVVFAPMVFNTAISLYLSMTLMRTIDTMLNAATPTTASNKTKIIIYSIAMAVNKLRWSLRQSNADSD